MVDSKYCTDDYQVSNFSVGTIIKNLEMLKFISFNLKKCANIL